MKHIDEYRDPAKVRRLIESLARAGREGGEGPVRIMEVCGTHTMAIFRFGLRQVLPENVELISGPGCPVCVTSVTEVDRMVELCGREGVVAATFGDMLRVPGTEMSLAQAKAQGGRVEVVYSTLEALDLARREPDSRVVFMGIGFETTSPTVAAAVARAAQEGISNFSVLSCHKTLPPALEALLSGGRAKVDGFLMPGHVSVMIGAKAYQPVAEKYRIPCVVTGFEPTDILSGILMLLEERNRGSHQVLIQYSRGVTREGNTQAMTLLDRVFEPRDSLWRGLGMIPGSGLGFRPALERFDAAKVFDLPPSGELEVKDPPGCRCGEVLQGILRPPECGLFGRRCTPAKPVGPCMVSSEGTCAAYFKYR
jgi:hydrogenase expression/formation protein HypD